jgi:hypothetical protein
MLDLTYNDKCLGYIIIRCYCADLSLVRPCDVKRINELMHVIL